MIYLIFLKRQIVIFRMNTQEFVEKSRGRRNTGGVNEHQRNLPAYDKSSDAERRMEKRKNNSNKVHRMTRLRLPDL